MPRRARLLRSSAPRANAHQHWAARDSYIRQWGVPTGVLPVTLETPNPRISVVAACKYDSTGNVLNSGQIALGETIAAGETLVLVVWGGGTGITLTPTDSGTHSWTSVTPSTCTGTPSTTQVFLLQPNASMGPTDWIQVARSASGSLSFAVLKIPTGYSVTVADFDNAFSDSASRDVQTPAVTVPDNSFVIMAGVTQNGLTVVPQGWFDTVASSNMTGTGNPRFGWVQAQFVRFATSTLPYGRTSTGHTWAAVALVVQPGSSASANAGADQNFVRTSDASVTLDGSASTGSTYSWTQTGGVQTVTIINSTSAVANFVPPAHPELLTFQLSVDGGASVDTVNIKVTPSNHYAEIGDSLTQRETTTAAPPDRYDETLAVLFNAGFWPDCQNVTQAAMGFYWYGQGGKQLVAADAQGKTTMQNIDEARAALGTVDKWIIALGTNNVGDDDATFNANMQTVIDYIGGDKIYWVNMAYWNPANTNALHFNPLILAKCLANNVVYGDWYTSVHTGFDSGDWIGAGDPTHMTVQGYARRDAFIASMISQLATVGMVATSTLTVAAIREQTASVAMTATSTLTVAAIREQTASVAMTATSTLTTTAVREQIASAALVSNTTLTVNAVTDQTGTAALVTNTTLTVTAIREKLASVAMTAVATLTTTAIREQVAAVAMTSTHSLTTTAVREAAGSVAMTSTYTLTTTAVREAVASVAMTATTTLTTTAIRERVAAVAMTANTTLTTAAIREQVAAVAMVATATMTASAIREQVAAAALVTTATLSVDAASSGNQFGTAALVTTATLSLSAFAERFAGVSLVANTTLTVAALREVLATVPLTATYTLTVAAGRTAVSSVAMTSMFILTVNAAGVAIGYWNGTTELHIAAYLWNGTVEAPISAEANH